MKEVTINDLLEDLQKANDEIEELKNKIRKED